MSIERVFGDLTPGLADALARETDGETVRWAARNSRLGERLQGGAIALLGLLLALANLAAPLAALGLLVDLAEKGRLPSGGYGAIALGSLGFMAGLGVAWLGWLSLRARKIVWAVTNTRLLRLVDGEPRAQSWLRRDISDFEKLNWNEPHRRAFALTARCHPECEVRLILTGPADIPGAEAAIAAIAG